MRKPVYEIDEKGYIKEIYVENTENTSMNLIITDPQDGLYRPKWTGTEWIEDMSQEEIDELKNRPKEPSFEELQLEYSIDLDYRISLIEMGLV